MSSAPSEVPEIKNDRLDGKSMLRLDWFARFQFAIDSNKDSNKRLGKAIRKED